jgi:early secretory antigenic target protein ESAT-6
MATGDPTRIKVNFGALDTGASRITTIFKDLQTLQAHLDGDVKPVLGSWSGTAREAYFKVQQSWNKLNVQYQQALNKMGGGITTANTNFQSAEKQIAEGWSSSTSA